MQHSPRRQAELVSIARFKWQLLTYSLTETGTDKKQRIGQQRVHPVRCEA